MNGKTINVKTSMPYEVIISNEALGICGKLISKKIAPCRAMIVTDDSIMPLYADYVRKSLENAHFKVHLYSFPAGELSKSSETLLSILGCLAENEFDRSDIIIALGGGVVGDIAGFASAIYKRGMGLIQIPTSLLAMVDSSVGGKTAINLPYGKNLAGLIKQPNLVICDPEVLKTLSNEQFSFGISEAIKCAVLFDSKLFSLLESRGTRQSFSDLDLLEIISACVAHKAKIVAEDEFDSGIRRLLNFGHTIGHAVERCSEYKIQHGQAVSIGMSIITAFAEKTSRCEPGVYQRLTHLLNGFGLPTSTDIDTEKLYNAVLSDKKRSGEYLQLIIPQKIGSCALEKISISQLSEIINLGREVLS